MIGAIDGPLWFLGIAERARALNGPGSAGDIASLSATEGRGLDPFRAMFKQKC